MASEEEVKAVALLSKIHIDDERTEKLTREFNSIVDFARRLDDLDVSDVEPMSHVHGLMNVFREDKVEHSLTREQGFRNAPDSEEDSFKVPLIIENEE